MPYLIAPKAIYKGSHCSSVEHLRKLRYRLQPENLKKCHAAHIDTKSIFLYSSVQNLIKTSIYYYCSEPFRSHCTATVLNL